MVKNSAKYKPYPAYRPSGVEWLGEIPAHWETIRLKSVLARNDSGVWGDEPGNHEGTIILRSTEQTIDGGWAISDPAMRGLSPREKADALLAVGDLVVTKSSGSELHIGKTSLVTEDVAQLQACFSNFMQRLRCLPALEPKLTWYVLNSPVGRQQLIFNSSTTTGLANLNRTILGELVTPIPPLSEQHAIATFLDRETASIGELVARKERLIGLLREKRTALITHAVTRGLDPNTPMQDSGVEWLGEIPAHWEVKRLKEIGMALIGLTYSPDDVVVGKNNGSLVLRASNISEGKIVLEDNVYVGCAVAEKLITREGDILICSRSGSRGLIGKNAIIDSASSGMTFGAFMTVYRSPHKDYLHYVFNSSLFEFQSGMFLTSTINQLTLGTLNGFRVPLPPDTEQRAIATFLDQETAKVDVLVARVRDAIDRLRELRTALISAAVTGRIDVREVLGE